MKAEETEMSVVDRVPHLQNLLNGRASDHALSLLRRNPELISVQHLLQLLPHLNVRSIMRTRLIKAIADKDLHLALVITADKNLHTRILVLGGHSDPSGIEAGITSPLISLRAIRLPSHLELNMNM